MTTFSPSYREEWPSFNHITLYQLCYWKVTCIYGLTQEEIETLITNPDPQTPSHHQVDQRIIKAYLTCESIPTYLPGHWLSRYFGILPMYLPRDWFLPSELVVPLVDTHYHQDNHIWKLRLDANKRATDYLVNHLRDPSGTVAFSRAIEAPESIPFVPTVRAAELRWWNGYLITYHSFNDLILLRGHYQNSFNWRPISTVSWHTGKSAQDIYATALTILQVGQLTIRLPPNPDFNRQSQPKRKGSDISRPPQSSQQPCSTEEIICSQSIIAWRHWTSSGIRSSHPGVCNWFHLQIPGHPITRLH
jgi:hypothetical protein